MAEITEFMVSRGWTSDRRGAERWIFSHAIHHWRLVGIALFGAVGNGILGAVAPILIGQALNLLLQENVDLARIGTLALLIGASQVIRPMLQFARNFGFELVAQRVEREIREELYLSLLGKSMTFHSLQPLGDTMARATNDVREVNYFFSPGVNMVVGSLNFLIIPVIAAPGYHPSLVLAPILFIIAYFIALKYYLKSLQPVTDEVRVSFGKLNTRLTEVLEGIETVKGSGQERGEGKRFKDNARRYRDAAVSQGDIEARYLPLLLYSLALGGGLLHALLLFQQGLLDVGQVVGYFGILMLLDFPTFISLWAYSTISLGLAGARRILDIMARENNLDQNILGYKEKIKGKVEFRNVDFRYGEDSMLQDITFSVEPGQTVAIVGQTGCGKTTLVKLINRTYDASEGQVLIDGVDVKDWNLEVLRKNISIIEQDIFLFSKSISDNISFGFQEATAEQVHRAADMAQARDFITSLNEGFKTVIGERGVTLSGGQRQRLALARAFLTDPAILILDDSTSAIDSATEDKIQQAIFSAAKGRTTFIITHRLSQIRWADLIILLKNGKVAAMGDHQTLMDTSEAYQRIFRE